tara:strand:+ start:4740 stop:5576 length:837 start_codon:yes stop_codon:yes gene_type:complete
MAINFPNTPVNGSTYDFNGVRYTYTQPNVLFEGYWRVTTPGSVGIATSNEISAGVDGAKYVTPLGLVGTVEWDQIETNRLAALQHIIDLHTPASVSGSTVFTNSDNNINLVGVGSIGLEIGDVITVTNSVLNSKEFTVEGTTDANNILVNEAHKGGTTSKSLVDETSNATITLLVKAASASIGLGRGRVDQTTHTYLGTYTNDTGRELFISLDLQGGGATFSFDFFVDGVLNLELQMNAEGTSGAVNLPLSYIIPKSSTYYIRRGIGTGVIARWNELR